MPNAGALGQEKTGVYSPIEWETFGHRNNDPTDLAYNRVQILESIPTDSANANGSLVLTYDSGNLVSITKTIGSVSYIKILSYTGTDLTGVSAWSVVA